MSGDFFCLQLVYLLPICMQLQNVPLNLSCIDGGNSVVTNLLYESIVTCPSSCKRFSLIITHLKMQFIFLDLSLPFLNFIDFVQWLIPWICRFVKSAATILQLFSGGAWSLCCEIRNLFVTKVGFMYWKRFFKPVIIYLNKHDENHSQTKKPKNLHFDCVILRDKQRNKLANL